MANERSIGVYLLQDNAVIPTKSHPTDSGFDLYSVCRRVIDPGEVMIIEIGIKFQLPPGWELQIRPRSGMAAEGVTVINAPGTIDQTYTGEIKVMLINHGREIFEVNIGDRVAQAVPKPVYEMGVHEISEEPTNSSRGDAGFGSTGR